jgi:hypothetical protein
MTVDEYITKLNEFYAQTRADDSVTKYNYDMSAIMEAVSSYNAKK